MASSARAGRGFRQRPCLEIEQRFRHSGVVGSEREWARRTPSWRPARQHVKNLLGVLVEVLALQIGKAGAGLRIEIGGQRGHRLRGGKKNPGGQQQGCAAIQTSASEHVRLLVRTLCLSSSPSVYAFRVGTAESRPMAALFSSLDGHQ